MKVRYNGPDEVEVPALGLTVQPGEVVELSDSEASGLVHQTNWAQAPSEPKPKAAKASDTPKEVSA